MTQRQHNKRAVRPPQKRRRKSRRPRLSTRGRRAVFLALGVVLLALLYVQCHRPMGEVDTRSESRYFETMAPFAQYYGRHTDIFPSLILAQSALESDFGRSQLAAQYHNYFGIKEFREGRGKPFPTLEVIDGQPLEIEDRFRVYDNVSQSVRDYTHMIRSMDRYQGVWQAATPEEAAQALVAGGYATDPDYAGKLIALIDMYDLRRYDIYK